MHPAAGHAGHADASIASTALITLAAIALCLYAAGVARAARRGGWHPWRTASFVAGILLIAAAMAPPTADWAHRDLRGHMAQHLLLGMFAPVALMLGAPGTLLLRTLPQRTARGLVTFLAYRPVRVVCHPVTAAVLDIGSMYALYLTPLHAFSMASTGMHIFLHVHFVLAGYLFSWAIAGPDPAPHRPGMPMRLAVVFLAMAAHGILGKLMYAGGYPAGTGADPAEIEAAAQWMYYGGDLAELLLVAILLQGWFRRRRGHAVAPAGDRYSGTAHPEAARHAGG